MHRFFQAGRRALFAVLALMAAALGAAGQAAAMPYIAVDINGRVLAQNQAFDRWYPASLTKMMTAYVTFRALAAHKISLDTPIELSPQAAKAVPSRSGWRAGARLKLDTALTVMLVKSANDMANAIAEAVGGSQANFVAEMNRQAQRLGLTGTHFANPSGLPDPDNYSDARDLAALAVQMRRDFPQYSYYFAIPAIDFGKGRKPVPNSNNLIGRYDGADGMKTGFICASGFNLVASATRRGRTIIAVVLGADRVDIREETAAKLLSNGFKTAGSPGLTLANMRPYGDKQSEVSDLRSNICTAEAGKLRLQYRDEKGHVIFASPFIAALNEHPAAVSVQPLYEPPAPPAAKKPRAKAVKAGSKTHNAGGKTARAESRSAAAHKAAKTKAAAKTKNSGEAIVKTKAAAAAETKAAPAAKTKAAAESRPPFKFVPIPAPPGRPAAAAP